jgi:hypothetical protein
MRKMAKIDDFREFSCFFEIFGFFDPRPPQRAPVAYGHRKLQVARPDGLHWGYAPSSLTAVA